MGRVLRKSVPRTSYSLTIELRIIGVLTSEVDKVCRRNKAYLAVVKIIYSKRLDDYDTENHSIV